MKIIDALNSNKNTLSFEVFPPKAGTDVEPIRQAVGEIAKLKPDFMSVTYGAGGGNSKNTLEIAGEVQKSGVTALAHITCIAATKEAIKERLDAFKMAGIENVLALRGDRPKDMPETLKSDFKYASELVEEIKNYGDFCIGAACYPEGHTECESRGKDLENLKIKADAGVDFLVTQMFFDNDAFYNFRDKAAKKGINLPITAGIMPLTNISQIQRMCILSGGASMPSKFTKMISKYEANPAALRQAGLAYAVDQIIELVSNDIDGIHLYTMNKPETAQRIVSVINSLFE